MFNILLKSIDNLASQAKMYTKEETEVNSTPTRPVENVLTTKGLQDRNIKLLDGTTVENKGKIKLIFIPGQEFKKCSKIYHC